MYETIMIIDQQTFEGSSWSPRNTLHSETVGTAATETEVKSWLWDWYFADMSEEDIRKAAADEESLVYVTFRRIWVPADHWSPEVAAEAAAEDERVLAEYVFSPAEEAARRLEA